MNDAKYIVQSDHREMKVNVRIFRDIDELKIWGNELGFRFLRDPEDKTKYRVLLTDDDVDKLETFVRNQQAEIKALKRANNVVGIPCDELKKMQERLAHLEKMIVWYQDITMTGINSTDYENGFWDAVNFVKTIQSQHGLTGMN